VHTDSSLLYKVIIDSQIVVVYGVSDRRTGSGTVKEQTEIFPIRFGQLTGLLQLYHNFPGNSSIFCTLYTNFFLSEVHRRYKNLRKTEIPQVLGMLFIVSFA